MVHPVRWLLEKHYHLQRYLGRQPLSTIYLVPMADSTKATQFRGAGLR